MLGTSCLLHLSGLSCKRHASLSNRVSGNRGCQGKLPMARVPLAPETPGCGGRRGLNATEVCGRVVFVPDAADAASWGEGFAGLFNCTPLRPPALAAQTEEVAKGDGGSELSTLCCAAIRSEAVSSRILIKSRASLSSTKSSSKKKSSASLFSTASPALGAALSGPPLIPSILSSASRPSLRFSTS